jgi:hypothetical protein
MEISAKKVSDILNLIKCKWKVGPTSVSRVIGYSRQTIHAWKQQGASELQYGKLRDFLERGPTLQSGHARNGELVINLSLRIDLINPSDEDRARIESAILLLEGIKDRYS